MVTTLWIIPIRLTWTTRTERIRTLMYDGSLISWSFGNSLTARVVRIGKIEETQRTSTCRVPRLDLADKICVYHHYELNCFTSFRVTQGRPILFSSARGSLKKVRVCRDSLRRLHHRRVSHGNLSSLIRAVFIFIG